jgi:FMN-dependent NADH-azoreductase
VTTYLRIDASAQLASRSLTRLLTGLFFDRAAELEPSAKVILRDLGHEPVPPIDHLWIQAAFTPPTCANRG